VTTADVHTKFGKQWMNQKLVFKAGILFCLKVVYLYWNMLVMYL